jgi:hypothetical protein
MRRRRAGAAINNVKTNRDTHHRRTDALPVRVSATAMTKSVGCMHPAPIPHNRAFGPIAVTSTCSNPTQTAV